MKMFLTRLGFGSKMVINGDKTQIDLPRGTESGLIAAESILKKVRRYSFPILGTRRCRSSSARRKNN